MALAVILIQPYGYTFFPPTSIKMVKATTLEIFSQIDHTTGFIFCQLYRCQMGKQAYQANVYVTAKKLSYTIFNQTFFTHYALRFL